MPKTNHVEQETARPPTKPSSVDWNVLPPCNNSTAAWLATLHELDGLKHPPTLKLVAAGGIEFSGND